MNELDEKTKRLIERRNFAHLGTLQAADGSPHVSPVWIDHDGIYILVNTAAGRAKPKNLALDKRVALSITDYENPYVYLLIQGEVVEITPDGASEHFDKLRRKYLDKFVPRTTRETRLLVRILARRIIHGG
jgi:PPOX class probable F420-dependent enzyme